MSYVVFDLQVNSSQIYIIINVLCVISCFCIRVGKYLVYALPNSYPKAAKWRVSVGGKMEKANWENSDRGCHQMSLTQTLVKDQQRVKKVEK